MKYSDVVILMAGVSNHASSYIKTLTDSGIPAYVAEEKGFFEREEIETVLAMLEVIDNPYNELLYIVLEPYSRKYGISFIEYDENVKSEDFDSVISPLNLNQEVNHILNDIFDGKGIEWDRKYDLSDLYDLNLENKDIIFPFLNVPQEWINDFLGIEKEYVVDYENEDIGESFMGFLSDINPQFKENVLAASSFLESHQK